MEALCRFESDPATIFIDLKQRVTDTLFTKRTHLLTLIDIWGSSGLKKALASVIWMELIATLLASSKVHETETKLICNTHAIFTHVGAGWVYGVIQHPMRLEVYLFHYAVNCPRLKKNN